MGRLAPPAERRRGRPTPGRLATIDRRALRRPGHFPDGAWPGGVCWRDAGESWSRLPRAAFVPDGARQRDSLRPKVFGSAGWAWHPSIEFVIRFFIACAARKGFSGTRNEGCSCKPSETRRAKAIVAFAYNGSRVTA